MHITGYVQTALVFPIEAKYLICPLIVQPHLIESSLR